MTINSEVVDEVNPQPSIPEYCFNRGGSFSSESEQVLNVITEKVAPLFEEHQFDFLFADKTPLYHTNHLNRYTGGGGVVYGRAECVNVDGSDRLLFGEGFIRVMLYDDVEIGMHISEFAEKVKNTVDGLKISSSGMVIPFCFRDPKDFRMDTFKHENGRTATIIDIPFTYGWQMILKPDFITMDQKITKDQKNLQSVLIELWERTEHINR